MHFENWSIFPPTFIENSTKNTLFSTIAWIKESLKDIVVVFTQNIHILTILHPSPQAEKASKIHISEKNGHHRNVSSASQLLYVVKSAIVLSDSLRERMMK